MKVKLTKIPSVVRNLTLPYEVEVSEQVSCKEGNVIIVKVLEDQNTNNKLEFNNGRLGYAVRGDVIPVVLGKRRALREYSGNVPKELKVGDTLVLLCESGIVGEINGINESWGLPLQVEVLGSLIIDGKQANIRDYSIPWRDNLDESAPLIAVVGTCMDCGKTTIISKLIKYFSSKGMKVAGTKLTGVSFMQDPLKMKDYGAIGVLDLTDAGLPSTCVDFNDVLQASLGLLNEINKNDPDMIFVEFGDGIQGEYNVVSLLKHEMIRRHIKSVVLTANDFVSAWGAKKLMDEIGLPITIVSGPAANTDAAIEFLENNLGVPTDNNLKEMSKTIKIIEKVNGFKG